MHDHLNDSTPLNTTNNQNVPYRDPTTTRVRISADAKAAFTAIFAHDPRPSDAMISLLSQAYGESFTRVRVWFQNRRGRASQKKGKQGRRVGEVVKVDPVAINKIIREAPDIAAIAKSCGSKDMGEVACEAISAMLTLTRIKTFWAQQKHLLSDSVTLSDGKSISLDTVAKTDDPIMASLVERVQRLREGVIGQFLDHQEEEKKEEPAVNNTGRVATTTSKSSHTTPPSPQMLPIDPIMLGGLEREIQSSPLDNSIDLFEEMHEASFCHPVSPSTARPLLAHLRRHGPALGATSLSTGVGWIIPADPFRRMVGLEWAGRLGRVRVERDMHRYAAIEYVVVSYEEEHGFLLISAAFKLLYHQLF